MNRNIFVTAVLALTLTACATTPSQHRIAARGDAAASSITTDPEA